MSGVQEVGAQGWLKILTPAQHGTSTYRMARKKAGLISELYLPASMGRACDSGRSNGPWATQEPHRDVWSHTMLAGALLHSGFLSTLLALAWLSLH